MPPPIKSYRDLLVWQKANDLVVESYRATAQLPKSETYGSVSGSRRDYAQFLFIAQGSLKELETHLIVAEKLSYLTRLQTKQLLSQTDELRRMLGSLIRKLKLSAPLPPKT